jgi:hypothetical protein
MTDNSAANPNPVRGVGAGDIGAVRGVGAGDIDVVLVTGLSGAGRGTAAKVLEDLGWYVADNLPPELIARMVDLGLAAGSRITQLAVVMDVRSRGFTGDLDLVRQDLATRDITPRVLFMEASDDILVRRYENNRRSHPLQGNQTLAEGIAAERRMLEPVRAAADLIIDTSALAVPALRASIERAFGGELDLAVESAEAVLGAQDALACFGALQHAHPGAIEEGARLVKGFDGDEIAFLLKPLQPDQLQAARAKVELVVGAEFAFRLLIDEVGEARGRGSIHRTTEGVLAATEIEAAERQIQIGDGAFGRLIGQCRGKAWTVA